MKAYCRAALIFLCASSVFADDLSKKGSFSTLLGVPHPITVALDYYPTRFFSVGTVAGYCPFPVNVPTGDRVDVSLSNAEGRFRLHPFKGAFFLGIAGGTYSISGKMTRDVDLDGVKFPVTGNLTVTGYYAIPHVGWIWQLSRRVILGMEFGWRFPLTANSKLSIPLLDFWAPQLKQTEDYQKLERDANDLGTQIGKYSLPFATLLRLGVVF